MLILAKIIFILFIYSTIYILISCQIYIYSKVIQSINSISNSREPQGVPAQRLYSPKVQPLNQIYTICAQRKKQTIQVIYRGTSRSISIQIIQLQLRVLNIAKKSSYTIKVILYQLQTIYTSLTRYFTAILVDLYALFPIQASSSRFYSLAIAVRQHITIASIIFPTRLSSNISYQPFIVPSSSLVLPSFQRTTIFIY